MTIIPEGTYNAVAVSITTDAGDETYAQFGHSKEKGTPQVVLNFQILDGEYANHRIAWIGYFTDKSSKYTIEALRRVGFKGDDLMRAAGQQLDNQVTLTVENEEWEGKLKAKVRFINAPGGAGMRLNAPMNAGELRNFAAKMKATVRSVGEVEGKKATPPPSESNDAADALVNF